MGIPTSWQLYHKATPYNGSAATGISGSPITLILTFTNITKVAPVATALYRVNAGGRQLDTSMGVFQADKYYLSAINAIASTAASISNTTDAALYQTERRAGNRLLHYNFGVANGTYTVILHFAETQWKAARQRQFDVTIESKKVLDNYDIYAKAGSNKARTETFTTTVNDGVLSINFSSLTSDGGIDYPTVAALEIMSAVTKTSVKKEEGEAIESSL